MTVNKIATLYKEPSSANMTTPSLNPLGKTMARRNSNDQKVAEAFVIGALLPALQASSDDGVALRGEVVLALFGQLAFEDRVGGTNRAAILLQLAQGVADGAHLAGDVEGNAFPVCAAQRGRQHTIQHARSALRQ